LNGIIQNTKPQYGQNAELLNVTAGRIRSDHCTFRTISDYFAILPDILTIDTVILVFCSAELGPGFQEPIKETIQAMYI
jgi:hypothetical protein